MRSPWLRRIADLFCLLTIALAGTVPAPAQHLISAKAGSIQYLEGKVFLDRTSIQYIEGRPLQMQNEQVLSTGMGYVELLLSPFSCLRLGYYASLRFRENTLTDIQLELIQGSAFIEVYRKLETGPIRFYMSGSVIEIKKAGLYRFDAEPGTIRVYGGEVNIYQLNRKIRVKNEQMFALNGSPKAVKFDPISGDALHRWAAQRSYTLYVRSRILSNTLTSDPYLWKARPEGLYNKQYRLTVPYDEDWKRYRQGTGVRSRKRMEQIESIQEAMPNIDPGR